MRSYQREAVDKMKRSPITDRRRSKKSKDITVVPGTVEKAYHRNGMSGNGFCVLTFDAIFGGERYKMVATVFQESGNIAVFDREKLGAGVIEFGLNSWRGDDFEKELREVIGEWN
jgi:hypothetical protein